MLSRRPTNSGVKVTTIVHVAFNASGEAATQLSLAANSPPAMTSLIVSGFPLVFVRVISLAPVVPSSCPPRSRIFGVTVYGVAGTMTRMSALRLSVPTV
jgi:hypothetical protein